MADHPEDHRRGSLGTPGLAAEIRAAGAIAWRPAGRQVQIALVHRPRYDDWSFAKGKAEPGEHILRTAMREVDEETGLRIILGRNLPTVRYLVSGQPKRVDYWTARVDPSAGRAFIPTSEVDQLAWLDEREAAGRLSYDHDAKLLAEMLAGPLDTVPLILLRHAAAGHRSDWPGDDADRPLDAGGERQAGALAGLLGCFGAGRVLSSPALRCLATVRPFAAAAGVQVEADPELGVLDGSPGPAARPAARRAVARALAGEQPAVLCAHRENLPLLLQAACEQLGAPVPAGPPVRKGEFWVLHCAAGGLAGAERHNPDGGELSPPAGRVLLMVQKGFGARPVVQTRRSAGRLGPQAVAAAGIVVQKGWLGWPIRAGQSMGTAPLP